MHIRSPQQPLQLAENIERQVLGNGTCLWKRRKTATYLALTLDQELILQRFRGDALAPAKVLCDLLGQQSFEGVYNFHNLILNAVRQRMLVDPANLAGEPLAPPALQAPLGWRFPVTLLGFVLLASVLVGLAITTAMPLSPVALLPITPWQWLGTLLVTSAGVSLAAALQACVLRGYHRWAYRPRLNWHYGFPILQIDTRDAFMGGRLCQAALAIQALSVPLAIGIAGIVLQRSTVLFGAHLLALILASPFGSAPGHGLLHAVFRQRYELPQCAARFLKFRLLSYLLHPRHDEREEPYGVMYSAYALAWLWLVAAFAGAILSGRGEEVVLPLLTAPVYPERLLALWTLLFAIALLVAPLLYELRILLGNLYAAFLAPLFPAERRARTPNQGLAEPDLAEKIAFLRSTLLFADQHDDALAQTASVLTYSTMARGTDILRQGDPGDTLFLIYAGAVVVLKEDAIGAEQPVATLGRGDIFGEIALLENTRRTATVRCTEPTHLLALTRAEFQQHLLSSMDGNQVKDRVQTCAFLRHLDVLRDWPDRALLSLAKRFELIMVKPEQTVVQQQHDNAYFYLVYEGLFEVLRDGHHIATLRPGDFFGEISLLKGIPPVATVVARTPAKCLRMSREQLFECISQDFLVGISIERVSETRLDKANHHR